MVADVIAWVLRRPLPLALTPSYPHTPPQPRPFTPHQVRSEGRHCLIARMVNEGDPVTWFPPHVINDTYHTFSHVCAPTRVRASPSPTPMPNPKAVTSAPTQTQTY